VWAGERKIAAVGVQISHGVTRHGAAVNVATDLSWFDSIIPCGIEDKEVTSVSRELGREVPVHDAAAALSEAFMQHYGYSRHELVPQESLQQMLEGMQ
jgi:lipoyl(octanoyl) transferase